MNLLATVLQIVAPVFLLAAVGFTWVKVGFHYPIEFVTKLGVNLAVPCLIFVSLMGSESDPTSLSSVAVAGFVVYFVVGILFWIGTRSVGLRADVYSAPLTFGNTGNLGLPLAIFAFGETGLGYAVVILAVSSILQFSVGIWMVSGAGHPWKIVKEPIVVATFLGSLFLWQGWETPVFITNSVQLIGQMAIPLMLITLGVAVSQLSPSHMIKATLLSAVKLFVCVILAWNVGVWLELEEIAFAVLLVQLATPVAVSSYLIAQKYGTDPETVAGLVVASTLLSIGTLPLLLAFLLP